MNTRLFTLLSLIVSIAGFVASTFAQYPKVAAIAGIVGAVAAALGKALFPEAPKAQ